jgi:hypothetical protein
MYMGATLTRRQHANRAAVLDRLAAEIGCDRAELEGLSLAELAQIVEANVDVLDPATFEVLRALVDAARR